jgi:hypothetical protein
MSRLSNLSKGLARGAVVLSPSCKEATRLQSESMDRKLSVWERMGLSLHLLLCKWCRRYRQQLGFLRSAAHQCDEHQASQRPECLSTEARERIKQKMKASQE